MYPYDKFVVELRCKSYKLVNFFPVVCCAPQRETGEGREGGRKTETAYTQGREGWLVEGVI